MIGYTPLFYMQIFENFVLKCNLNIESSVLKNNLEIYTNKGIYDIV